MPSSFAAAMARADVVFDQVMGDRVRITPMANTDFGERADDSRPAFEIVVLVNFLDPSAADVTTLKARIAYEETEIEIRREVLAGRQLRKDDQVQLLDHPAAPRLKVSRIDTLDPTRLILTLSRLSAKE